MSFCSKCGKETSEDAQFCGSCGESLSNDSPVTTNTNRPTQGEANMELIQSGKLKILKGEKLVVVTMKKEFNLEDHSEFYEFVDGLLKKGYRAIQIGSSSSIYGHEAVMVKD